MNIDIVNNLVCRFYEELIKNGDNLIPTKVSIVSYGYFQLLYNILTIFGNYLPSTDRINIYNWHSALIHASGPVPTVSISIIKSANKKYHII